MAKSHIEHLPLEALMQLPGNTNRMSDAEFNALCEGIESSGVIPPIIVAPRDGRYVIVDGNHRFRAAALLEYDGLDCVVLDLVDEELQDILSARMNIVRGHVDRDAFTKLWLRVRQRSDQRQSMAILGITSEAQLDRCVRLAKRRMDAEIRAKEEVEILLARAQIVQDMATIIRALHGDGGLGEFQYLVFQLRGSEIALVRCTDEELEELRVWLAKVRDTGVGVAEGILQGLRTLMLSEVELIGS